jgi:hypothetical protein
MSKFSIWKIAIVGAAILFNDGCMVNQRITRRSEIGDPLDKGPLMILTKDSSLYTLTNYKLKDSTMVGSGSVRKQGTVQNFSGELKFADIGYIQAQSSNALKGMLIGAFTGYFRSACRTFCPAEDQLSIGWSLVSIHLQLGWREVSYGR